MNSYALDRSNETPLTASSPRVGIVYRLSHPGGVQSVVLSLIKGLNARGITPDLIWDVRPSQKLLDEKGVKAGFQPVHFQMPSLLLDQAPITAAYILRTAQFFTTRDLPHPYDFYYIFFNGFLVEDNTPHVYYLNGPPLVRKLEAIRPGAAGLPFRMMETLYKTVLRSRTPIYDYHRSSPYVINSEFTAQLFEEEHHVRLPVVHPPIDLAGRSFSADDLARRDTITFFSRFVDFKRPEMFLKLAERHPDRRLLMMGGVKPQNRPYFELLRQKASSAGIKNITFVANPSDSQVREELARTRFFVFLAVNEHFGMATAEAIASGAVPYVHDSGGQREIVPDPRLRFTDREFLDKFDALLHMQEDALNDIRFRLREQVAEFSEEAFIEKMLAFLDRPMVRPVSNEPRPKRLTEKNEPKEIFTGGKSWSADSDEETLKNIPRQNENLE